LPIVEFKRVLDNNPQLKGRLTRFAAFVTDTGDRARLEAAAKGYQSELDALSSPDAKSDDTPPPSDTIAEPTAPDAAAPSDAIAATDDATPTTAGDTGEQETD
jgi:hypothetical protein